MRFAVIQAGSVINVIEADADFTLEGFDLVASDIAGPGWSYDGVDFHPPPPEPAPVPPSISPLQARRALRAAGLIDEVNVAVSSADADTQDAWEYATEIRRDNEIIAAMAAQFGLTDAQVDDLFRAGAAL